MIWKLAAYGIEGYIAASEAAFRAVSRVPVVRRAVGLGLDMVLGPADTYEYVVTSAPSSPPPTIS